MSVHPKPENAPQPPRGDHAAPDERQRDPDTQTSSHGSGASADAHAHGAHGKGGSEELLVDPQAVDTGDDPQLRTAGGGGDQAPDPNKFRENSEGRMGGPGWGSEAAGGSSVDRRPPHDRKA